jgi:hypothetical protein
MPAGGADDVPARGAEVGIVSFVVMAEAFPDRRRTSITAQVIERR